MDEVHKPGDSEYKYRNLKIYKTLFLYLLSFIGLTVGLWWNDSVWELSSTDIWIRTAESDSTMQKIAYDLWTPRNCSHIFGVSQSGRIIQKYEIH
jgi:hypothetical protein